MPLGDQTLAQQGYTYPANVSRWDDRSLAPQETQNKWAKGMQIGWMGPGHLLPDGSGILRPDGSTDRFGSPTFGQIPGRAQAPTGPTRQQYQQMRYMPNPMMGFNPLMGGIPQRSNAAMGYGGFPQNKAQLPPELPGEQGWDYYRRTGIMRNSPRVEPDGKPGAIDWVTYLENGGNSNMAAALAKAWQGGGPPPTSVTSNYLPMWDGMPTPRTENELNYPSIANFGMGGYGGNTGRFDGSQMPQFAGPDPAMGGPGLAGTQDDHTQYVPGLGYVPSNHPAAQRQSQRFFNFMQQQPPQRYTGSGGLQQQNPYDGGGYPWDMGRPTQQAPSQGYGNIAALFSQLFGGGGQAIYARPDATGGGSYGRAYTQPNGMFGGIYGGGQQQPNPSPYGPSPFMGGSMFGTGSFGGQGGAPFNSYNPFGNMMGSSGPNPLMGGFSSPGGGMFGGGQGFWQGGAPQQTGMQAQGFGQNPYNIPSSQLTQMFGPNWNVMQNR